MTFELRHQGLVYHGIDALCTDGLSGPGSDNVSVLSMDINFG